MRKASILAGLSLVLGLSQTQAFWWNPELKNITKLSALNLDKDSVTVSGLSSGAFMAVQLGVAYSDQIKGVGAIAGGIYSCAQGSADTAKKTCMKSPEDLVVSDFVALTQKKSQDALIDSPKNLQNQRIFILSGTQDKVVLPKSSEKLAEFYRFFGNSPEVNGELEMGHAFPSAHAKAACEASQFPWMNQCGYDGAKAILESMYGPLKMPSSRQRSGRLISFDQTEFNSKNATMLNSGHVYIPASCTRKSTKCRLHIALHGCLQNPTVAGLSFVERAGYNDWADANNIVILYPAADFSANNKDGCWDWWGYTGENYAVKSGLQMTAIMKMVQRLTEN